MESVAELSAVDRFESWLSSLEESVDVGAARLASYQDLLPAVAPGGGRQYRFEVDLDRCTGCKACVTACHSLNGLDEDETWRAVGLLSGGSAKGRGLSAGLGDPVWTQHVTTACHHCVDPACLAGCPVDAYEKDSVTGIVAHLDDQCIGCRYCILMCPYEVPSFNARLGIVRKCDMCTHRLEVGEPPACVQGCPTRAISIGLTDPVMSCETGPIAAAAESPVRLVPTAPPSHITGPTTVYLTDRRVPSDVLAGDHHSVEPAQNHPPLVAMLVLTQLSIGAVTVVETAGRLGWLGGSDGVSARTAIVAFVGSLVAMGAAVGHLGRPLVAWRALLGFGHSWLSREIVAFGAFAAVAGLAAGSAIGLLPRSWQGPLGAATVLAGLLGLWCSARLYSETRHPLWRLDRVLVRFVSTTVAGGSAVVAAMTYAVVALGNGPGAAAGLDVSAIGPISAVGVAGGVVAMVVSAAVFQVRHRGSSDALGRSARLMAGHLRGRVLLATGLGVGAVLLAVAGAMVGERWPDAGTFVWVGALMALLAAGWVERSMFFMADSPDRMPGGQV